MPNRTIGNYYDVEKFNNIINKSTLDLVKSTMGDDAETDKGREFVEQAATNLKANFSLLPVSYYQALEAFVDGGSLGEHLKNADERSGELDALSDGSFIDLVLACSDGKLAVKNEKAAVNYYNRLFPEAQIDRAVEVSDEPASVDKSASRVGINATRKERIEDIRLSKKLSAYEKAQSKLDGLSEADVKGIKKARRSLARTRQKLDAAKEKAILSARKRLERGEITREHFDVRISEIKGTPASTATDLIAPVQPESVDRRRIDFKEQEINRYVPQKKTVHTREISLDKPELGN